MVNFSPFYFFFMSFLRLLHFHLTSLQQHSSFRCFGLADTLSTDGVFNGWPYTFSPFSIADTISIISSSLRILYFNFHKYCYHYFLLYLCVFVPPSVTLSDVLSFVAGVDTGGIEFEWFLELSLIM